jgi:SpoVK/Ycf46/Vps4 family AAA+-type ATPase
MFGALVSWMSLKTCPVFIVGTLNNVDAMPPELLRKGRFDEVWWSDLPTAEERVSIFNVLLQYKFEHTFRVPASDHRLVRQTENFSGAEIEAAIEEALYDVLTGSKLEFEALLSNAVGRITPQAKIDPEGLIRMREKARAFRPTTEQKQQPVIQAIRGRKINGPSNN